MLRPAGFYHNQEAGAMAYDKAALYLYGGRAITNFGVAACLEDPTEVSAAAAVAAASTRCCCCQCCCWGSTKRLLALTAISAYVCMLK
jgi:hypothetical protein